MLDPKVCPHMTVTPLSRFSVGCVDCGTSMDKTLWKRLQHAQRYSMSQGKMRSAQIDAMLDNIQHAASGAAPDTKDHRGPSAPPKKERKKQMASPKDRFQRFIKFLEMTRSGSDNEILAAIKRANAILDQQHMSWEELLTARVKFITGSLPEDTDGLPSKQPPVNGRVTDDNLIRPKLDFLLQNVHDNFIAFIRSVDAFYKARGYLSVKQYEVIESAYNARI